MEQCQKRKGPEQRPAHGVPSPKIRLVAGRKRRPMNLQRAGDESHDLWETETHANLFCEMATVLPAEAGHVQIQTSGHYLVQFAFYHWFA